MRTRDNRFHRAPADALAAAAVAEMKAIEVRIIRRFRAYARPALHDSTQEPVGATHPGDKRAVESEGTEPAGEGDVPLGPVRYRNLFREIRPVARASYRDGDAPVRENTAHEFNEGRYQKIEFPARLEPGTGRIDRFAGIIVNYSRIDVKRERDYRKAVRSMEAGVFRCEAVSWQEMPFYHPPEPEEDRVIGALNPGGHLVVQR